MKTRMNLRHNAKGRGMDATSKILGKTSPKRGFVGAKARRTQAKKQVVECIVRKASAAKRSPTKEAGKRTPTRHVVFLRNRRVHFTL